MNKYVSTLPGLMRGWLPRVPVAAIVTHWTAGGPTCSDLDRQHYHFIIDQRGHITRGHRSIADNAGGLKKGRYAAHTRGFNARDDAAVIGVAVCGMAGALSFPFRAGRFPIKVEQMQQLAYLVALLCDTYNVEVSPRTVLTHGEVQQNLGILQLGKWDITRLPYAPELTKAQICDGFRENVSRALAQFKAARHPKTPRLLLSVESRAAVTVPGARLVDGAWLCRGDALQPLMPGRVLAAAEFPLRRHISTAGYNVNELMTTAHNFVRDSTDPRAIVYAVRPRS